MKIETANRYIEEIAKRLVLVNGVIPTPRGEYECLLVKKAWVFGSTIKGSFAPNDLDILLFTETAGLKQKWESVGFDPVQFRNYGIHVARSTRSEAGMWLRRGLKMVSIHDTLHDETIFDKKIEIFPSFLFQKST